METLQAIGARRSIRSYKDIALEREELEKIVRAGGSMPISGEIFMSVITDAGILGEIDEKTFEGMKVSESEFMRGRAALPGYRPLYGAPALIIVSAREEDAYGVVNAANAATAMTIAATDMGLGSCFVVSFKIALSADASICGRVGVPSGFAPVCGVLLGHTEDENRFSRARAPEENFGFTFI